MTRLFQWKARRSGAHMTITAVDENGAEVTTTKIECIEINPDTGSIFAFEAHGQTYQLMSGKPA